jgi:hypothetical protein
MSFDEQKWGVVGGDCEPPRLLDTLARRHPEDDFVLIGRASPVSPQEFGLPENVINPWIEWDKERKQLTGKENGKRQGTQLSMDTRRKFVSWVDRTVLPECTDLDGMIFWLGQHGSVHAPDIPKVSGNRTDTVTPQDWAVMYGAPVIRGINMFRAKDPHRYEEVWLCTDARNYLKPHDLKWPLKNPILAQYRFDRDFWVQRYGDPRTPEESGWTNYVKSVKESSDHWKCNARYIPSNLEISALLPQHSAIGFDDNFKRQHHFGLFINEARPISGPDRPTIMRDWIRVNGPDWIHGQWSTEGLQIACVDSITPLPVDQYFAQLRATRCTFTTPSSGSGWTTAKPWEAFACGVVCFRHPQYDDQDNTYGRFSPEARTWLSPATPHELYARLEHLKNDESTWRWLVTEQKRVYDDAVANLEHIDLIEKRIWK